jgi:hypothetical protein
VEGEFIMFVENKLQREVLEMELTSPIFDEMREQLDAAIKDCITRVYNKEFESGEVTLKLSIELPETYKILPKEGKYGEMSSEKYYYRKPRFKHNTTTSLKKQFKTDGVYTDDREVQLDDDVFIAKKIDDRQISLFDK